MEYPPKKQTDWKGNRVVPPPDAPGAARLLKAGGGFAQPDIWVVEDGTGEARVWKTWHRRPWWERALVGRWLARREARILRRLDGLEGFPRLLGRPHRWTVEMSLLDAEPVPEVKAGGALEPVYFERLWGMIEEMHARGINHGDLRRMNLLRAPGNPAVPRMVDFTQCLSFRTPVTGLRGLLFRQAVRVDRVTFLKLKRWFLGPEHLTEGERAEFALIPWHLRVGRFLRKRVYRPFKHWRKGEKRKKRRV